MPKLEEKLAAAEAKVKQFKVASAKSKHASDHSPPGMSAAKT